MTVAVFDSSAVLAIVFDEPGADRAQGRLDGGIISSVNYSETLAKMIEKGFTAADAIHGLAALTLPKRVQKELGLIMVTSPRPSAT